MTPVEGRVNGVQTKVVLDPDGKGSHWFQVDPSLRAAAGIHTRVAVTMTIEPLETTV